MINKCKAQMIRKSLYNTKKPPWRGGKKKEDNTVACKRTLIWWFILINKIPSLLKLRFFDDNSFYSCLFVPQFHASHCSTHLNLVLRPILYKIHCIGLFWTRIPCDLGLGSKFCPYNWRRLWERTWVLVSATVKHGRVRSTTRKSTQNWSPANRTHQASAAK